MDTENRLLIKDSGERISAFALAFVTTMLVLAAINVGFSPHATALVGHAHVVASLSL